MEQIINELLNFGFREITKQLYEDWKVQRAFKFKNSYWIIIDGPNVILCRGSHSIDRSMYLSIEQMRGLFAFLKLTSSHQAIIHAPILHLNEYIHKTDCRLMTRAGEKKLLENYKELGTSMTNWSS